MSYHTPLGYPTHPGEAETPYGAGVLPTGMASFAPPTPILPQYSNTGRMQPEFLDNVIDNEDVQEDRPIIARGHATKILGYAPREGTFNTRILVRLLFRRLPQRSQVSLRVKMGNIPLMTGIEGIESVNGVGGEWRLHVVAPDPIELNIVGLEVPLIVQALDVATATIIDDVCIGPFKFWENRSTNEHSADVHSADQPPFPRTFSLDDTDTSSRAEGNSPLAVSHSLDDSGTISEPQDIEGSVGSGSARRRARLSIEVPAHDALDLLESPSPELSSPTVVKSLVQSSQESGGKTYPASLKLHGDLNSMTEDWTPEEVMDNRRIVEFFCVRTRGCINVEFAPVSGEDARDTNKIVVSCIWWDDMEEFIITSVDAISLLEKLVGIKFSTEEKNRIRRNLQGFKPSTVSKHHPESKSFFQTLMEFPAPRPRNIEKDVKAFGWSKLPNMLEKVISKYWFVATPSGSDSEESQNNSPRIRIVRDLDSTSGESPSTVGPPLSATHTPNSTQSLQADVRPSRTGILPSSESFMSSPSPAAEDPDPFHAGSLENSIYPDGPGLSQGAPIYGTLDSLMEISESSIDEMGSFPMREDHMASEYHEHGDAYPEAMGMSHPGGFYSHDARVNEMPSDGPHGNMHYMAHTSHEYA